MSTQPPIGGGGMPPMSPSGPPPGPTVRPREKSAAASPPAPVAAPPGPTGPAGPAGPVAPAGKRTAQIVAFVVALAVGVGGGMFLGRGTAEAGEVLLEAAPSVGPDPFTPPPEKPDEPTPPATAATTASPTASPTAPSPATTPPQPPPSISVTVGGRQVGLYGGSGSERVCDVEQLVAFLSADPAKAAAWAQVQGIPVAQLPQYLRSLRPTFLQVDTRVTNHGFRNGVATPRQSVLQAGTAVLVDSKGVPRARCKCGNPLLPPAPIQGKPVYAGARWPDFNPGRLASVGRLASAPPTPTASATGTPARTPTGPAGNIGNVSGAYQVTDFQTTGDCGEELTVSEDRFSVRQTGSRVVFIGEDGTEELAVTMLPDGTFQAGDENGSLSGRFTGSAVTFTIGGDDCTITLTARRI